MSTTTTGDITVEPEVSISSVLWTEKTCAGQVRKTKTTVAWRTARRSLSPDSSGKTIPLPFQSAALGDIPLLGLLFQNKNNADQDQSVLEITPKILIDSMDKSGYPKSRGQIRNFKRGLPPAPRR